MRLRYLHLPRCGPLVDLAIVFGQEELLFGWAPDHPAKRKGAINFIVGINGTGKSSLLRAVYQTFRALKSREFPALPVTLAWDWHTGSETVTAFFHHPGPTEDEALFSVAPQMPGDSAASSFQSRLDTLKSMDAEKAIRELTERKFGDAAVGSALEAFLPRRVVAYTSGAEALWDALEQAPLLPYPEAEGLGSSEDDRPPGWAIEREWEEERPVRVANLLMDIAAKPSDDRATLPGGGHPSALSPEMATRLSETLEPLAEIGRKVVANQAIRTGRPADPCFRVRRQDLRLAAHSLGLWQAARELAQEPSEVGTDALRRTIRGQAESGQSGSGARRVLNQVDWFWPTHLSLIYRDADDRVSRAQREQLLCLCALADEVVAQPLGRFQVVVSLGPRDLREFDKMVEESLTLGLPSEGTEALAKRMAGSKTGAEAVLRLFSEDTDLEGTLLHCFEGLKSWRDAGLLEDFTLTIKRLQPTSDARGGAETEGAPDRPLVLYDQLSDGEQVLLARAALLLLLRGQDGSLLLLDEPETHFNDAWKRELIDLVDDNILKETRAQVILSSHTSIALTDVFAAEITLLKRQDGVITNVPVPFPTFGEEPGEIMVRLFGAPETIGRRAAEWLDELIRRPWPVEQHAELERILGRIGAGYYRSELRAALRKLGNAPPP